MLKFLKEYLWWWLVPILVVVVLLVVVLFMTSENGLAPFIYSIF
jgi:uncharacterized membrane protein